MIDEPYEPTLIRYEGDVAIEYATQDVPYFVRAIDDRFWLLLSMETREVIGFRLYGG